jgi:hypothetical protein
MVSNGAGTGGVNIETLSYGMSARSLQGAPRGLKLDDSALLNLGLSVAAGFDSNVFYSRDAHSSPVLTVTPVAALSNAERGGARPSGVYYDLSAALQYREYLSSDTAVKGQRAINPSAGGTLEFSSGQTLSLSITESFNRLKDPPYTPSPSGILRDHNMAGLQLKVAPNGGRFQIIGRYSNVLDIYEQNPYSRNNNMGNELVLDMSWRWLPKTALYVQAAQGMITYLDSTTTQRGSYPLKAILGLRGLLTPKLALNVAGGYTNGFYSSGGANPTGFGAVALAAEVMYTVSALNEAGIGYRHDIRNSPQLGDFYNYDAVYIAFRQLVAGRVSTMLYGRFENRTFHAKGAAGLAGDAEGRVDQFFMAGLSADYFLTELFYFGVFASLDGNRTNRSLAEPAPGVGYTKFQALGRLGIVY